MVAPMMNPQPIHEPSQGWFSILRYVPDPVRDEATNLGVVLVDAAGKRALVEYSPAATWPHSVPSHDTIEHILVGLKRSLEAKTVNGPQDLVDLSGKLSRTLVLTPPKPVAV